MELDQITLKIKGSKSNIQEIIKLVENELVTAVCGIPVEPVFLASETVKKLLIDLINSEGGRIKRFDLGFILAFFPENPGKKFAVYNLLEDQTVLQICEKSQWFQEYEQAVSYVFSANSWIDDPGVSTSRLKINDLALESLNDTI